MWRPETTIWFHLFPNCPFFTVTFKNEFHILVLSIFFSLFSWSLYSSWNQVHFSIPASFPLFLARKSNILFSKTFYLFLNWWKSRSYQLLTSFLSCLLVLYHTYFILINVTTSFGWLIFHIYIPFYPFKTRFIFIYLSNDIHYCYLTITVQDTNSKWKKFIMSSNS